MEGRSEILLSGLKGVYIERATSRLLAWQDGAVAYDCTGSDMRKIPVNVRVNDTMQRGYRYVLTEPVGRNFDPEFRPELTPKQMLALGIFCGKYMTDCRKEFPASWFANARLSSCRDCSLNYFGVDASQPLSVWRKNGWIHPDDPRGLHGAARTECRAEFGGCLCSSATQSCEFGAIRP